MSEAPILSGILKERVFFFHVCEVDAATVAVAFISSALKVSRNTE